MDITFLTFNSLLAISLNHRVRSHVTIVISTIIGSKCNSCMRIQIQRLSIEIMNSLLLPLTHILIRIDHVEPFVILFVTLYKLVHRNSIVNTPQAGLYVVTHKCIILQTAQLGVVNWFESYKSLILYYRAIS